MAKKKTKIKAQKTTITADISDCSTRKKRYIRKEVRMNQAIKDLVEATADQASSIKQLITEDDSMRVLNKVRNNQLMNMYLNQIFETLNQTKNLNNQLLDKIVQKRANLSASENAKLYIRTKELENENLKLITEFCKYNDVQLTEAEQNIFIIYRSLPPHLQQILYETIVEFVKQCPAIQREIQNQNR